MHNWMLILVALGSGGMLLWPRLKGGATQSGLPVTEAVQKINREKAVLVDVRDAAEYQAERIAQARNVPQAQLEERLPQLVKNKNVPVLLVCAQGRRSAAAVATAKKLGYQQVYSLAGGMAGWKHANMPVVSAAAA